MLQFKNRFIDQLLEKYKYGLKFDENSEKRKKILQNIEEILKKYLEIFQDKKEKNYIEIQKYILQFFFDNGIDLFKKEVKVNENKEKIRNHTEQLSKKEKMEDDENVHTTIEEEDTIEKTIIGKKTNRIKGQQGKSIKKKSQKKRIKKETDEEIEIQEEENEEQPEEEEEKSEKEEKEEGESHQRGKRRKIESKQQTPKKKRENSKKTEENSGSSQKVLHHPKISKKIKARPPKSSNIIAVKSPKKETNPKKNYPAQSPKKVTPQKATPKKETPNKQTKVTPEKRSTPQRQNSKSPRQLRSSSSKKQQNEPRVTNLKVIKIPSSPIQNLNIKPKSIIKRAKLDSPKNSLKSSGSKRGSSGKEKHFFEELEEKYNNQKKKSPSKFNVTPMKKKKSSTKTPVKEIKDYQSSTKKQELSSGKKKIKNEMLGKKRGISFSTDRYVKEFDPKTPVKEIKTRVIRKSPIERKNKIKTY